MKYFTIKIAFLLCIILIPFSVKQIYSVNPTYTLTITNDQQVDSKNYEFDIYLLRTGATAFSYSTFSQYSINFNSLIKNGGTISFSINAGTCALIAAQQITSGDLSVDAVNNRLIISTYFTSTFTTISNTAPGTKLGRFRVTNTANFGNAAPNLSWNSIGTSATKILMSNFTDITNTAVHFVIITNGSLPVVLSSFNSSVSTNNVALSWTTTSEINNSGFEIYRTIKDNNQWTKIGFDKGYGTSVESHNYAFTDNNVQAAVYDYKLKQIDFNGNAEYYSLQNDVIVKKPGDFKVSQNYPNPSNPKTKIDYQIPFDGKISLKVFDMTGKEVATLVNENKSAGYYTSEFDGSNVASGIYFYRITAAGNGQEFSKTLKMVLVR